MTIAFALQKSDVVLESRLSDKQSLLQLLAVIASTVVSLFSIFAIAFRITERHVLGPLGWTPGHVATHSHHATPDTLRTKQLQQVDPDPADSASQSPHAVRIAFADGGPLTPAGGHRAPLNAATSPSGAANETDATAAIASVRALTPPSVVPPSSGADTSDNAVRLHDKYAHPRVQDRYRVATPIASGHGVLASRAAVRVHATREPTTLS